LIVMSKAKLSHEILCVVLSTNQLRKLEKF